MPPVKKKSIKKELGQLNIGDCFCRNKKFYIKTDMPSGYIELSTGKTFFFTNDYEYDYIIDNLYKN